MRIGIDARMYGPTVGGGGLGRYVEQLVNRLPSIDSSNRYVLFVKTGVDVPTSEYKTIETNIHWYTFAEQLFLAPLIDREQLDLVHFPHWNVPIFLKTPYVVTIHDLILLEQPKSAHATTRNPLVYAIKHAVYKHALRRTIRRAKHIIAVSQYTKDAILKHVPKTDPAKISVVYEGLTDLNPFPERYNWAETTPAPKPPYLLSIGNSYPHKNLPRLIQAFEQLAPLFPDLRLVLAGRRDVFFDRIEEQITASPVSHRIDHIANPSDQDLAKLFTKATLYVFPSLSEGFGLPPLEAMQFNVPVVSSKTTCLPEILGDAAVYMDPTSVEDMAYVITSVLKDPLQQEDLRKKGHQCIKRYDWNHMTRSVVDVYTHCAH